MGPIRGAHARSPLRRLPDRHRGAPRARELRSRGAVLSPAALAAVGFRDLGLRGFYSAADDRLGEFYVPVLSSAVTYDRLTGYFRSSSLVVAAAGLSRFLARGGTVRLIAGAELGEDDVRAVSEGEPLSEVLARRLLSEDPLAGADIVAEHRLATLAWLVREDRLQIKIGVPTDHLGRPLRPSEASRYFHSKYGLLRDEAGDQIAFMGSDNESASGWRHNHESFTVAKSWHPQTWADQGEPIRERFEAHWGGHPDLGWAVVDLPRAVRERLVSQAKPEPPPVRDPEEERGQADDALDLERLRFVAGAPQIGGGTGVGFATTGVAPWPHQLAIAERAVRSYPRGYLLADEVGLGKTIEAGLILRELLCSGRAEKMLVLVPASVLRQWQEELFEKFALELPRLEGGRFLALDGSEVPWSGGNPWRAFGVVLASSHLARRRSRRDEVLAAGPWDVVLVDEAHHARRQGGKADGTPNALLSLLQQMKLRRSWGALYLASATPMQMHPHEAWDLLELLGLPGRWGQGAEPFVRYYSELREEFSERDWPFLQALSADFFADPAVRPDPVLVKQARAELGMAGSRPIRKFAELGLRPSDAQALTRPQRDWMGEWLRANTPMRDRVFRTTRHLLRLYKQEGLISPDTTVPVRKVDDRFVPMTAAESALYDRVETYIARHYNAYMAGPAAQKALGFIMTVYRRRLTSSFFAIERSLSRRLEGLLGHAKADALLDADDLIALEGSALLDLDRLERPAQELAGEVEELRDFLEELAERPPDESKMQRLHDELGDAFHGAHDTAIVFTQYTDTMEYLRDQLRTTYGERIVCYSGRGGERFDTSSGEWLPLPKEEVKRLFREGREVKVLLGTDSLSEGLNLQTCAKLVNYDVPWNFMRVEQRIGRVDRIGGRPLIEVSNYFYQGTIEEQIYRGIGEDYDWFTDVVGPAQPVLSQVERVLEDVALEAPGERRLAHAQERAAELRAQIEQAKAQAITLGDLESAPDLAQTSVAPAIGLEGLERVLTSARATAERLVAHPSIEGAYILKTQAGEVAVTFRRAVLEKHAPAVRLLTYLTPELDELLTSVGVATPPPEAEAGARSLEELERQLAADPRVLTR